MNVISDIKNYFLLILIGSTILFGAYLTNISVVLVQPDNSELHCFTSGDEYYSWLHDDNGLPIIQSQLDGFYYYGDSLYENQDMIYPELIKKVLPMSLVGVFAAIVMGAVLSTFNSVLNSAATIFSLDIYKGYFNKHPLFARKNNEIYRNQCQGLKHFNKIYLFHLRGGLITMRPPF